MLKFDVNSKPPSQTAIDTEINKLNKDMLSYFKKECILALLVIVIGLIILNQCSDYFATLWNLAVDTAKGAVTLRTIMELEIAMVPIFMITAFVHKVINPIEQIKMQLFFLNSFNNLKLIEELANTSPLARDYLKQLGDINRHITRLEFNLLKEGDQITKEFEKFISKDESLVHTNHIIKWNGLAVATNGHVMVWAECEDKPTSISKDMIDSISSLIEKHQTLDFKSFIFPDLNQKPCSICEGKGFVYQKATEECSECHGDGSLDLQSNCNTYNVQCQSCDGHGSTDSDKTGSKIHCTSSSCFNGLQLEDMMPFEDGVLNPCYLNDFRNYPGIQVATTPDESGVAKIFYFKSSNGINAIIMGCRP